MVSSSHVGDAINFRCADAVAVARSATATKGTAIRSQLLTMTISASEHLATRPEKQGHAAP